MRTACEDCGKTVVTLIEFNYVLLCIECFDKQIKKRAMSVIDP